MKLIEPAFWTIKKQQYALGITAFLFIAAVFQVAIGWRYVLPLTPILLALIAGLSLLIWDVPARTKALLAIGALLLGYIVELIGVQTGLLFGSYSYGTLMGFKLWGVPVVIGITWLIVTLSAWHIVSFGSLKTVYKFLLAGVLVVMFDLLLEQFAVVYGFWMWQGGHIPIGNYVTWFFVSGLFFGAYYWFSKKSEPSLYIAGLLPVMAMFFWLMLIAK